MSSQPFFQKTKQVIWWCEVRTVGWMWQHCPSKLCDGLCSVHIFVWCAIVMEEQYYIETVTSLNVHLHLNCLIKKMSEMLVLCYNPRLHTNVRTTDTITNFGWTGLPHLPFSPSLTCVVSLKERKKESLRRHDYASDEAMQNVTF
jgi:hypothetical protein